MSQDAPDNEAKLRAIITSGGVLSVIAVHYNAASTSLYAAIVEATYRRRSPDDPDRSTHLWECDHYHTYPGTAIQCGRKELRILSRYKIDKGVDHD